MLIHYALQACDLKSYQNQKRYASSDRTEISKKSIKSFLEAVSKCSTDKDYTEHHIAIICDSCSQSLLEFINLSKELYTSDKVKIEIQFLEKSGIMQSIKHCYEWLRDNGKNLVYQVQDDYLFSTNSIVDMVEVYETINAETGTQPLISPYNDSWLWQTHYRNISTPRTVIVGKRGYWIQYYDMSCSFLTSHEQFIQHWDLYLMFFYLIDHLKENNNNLENRSLNYMLTRRGVLGLVPINSLAFHLQSDLEKDPHLDYRPLWNSINVT